MSHVTHDAHFPPGAPHVSPGHSSPDDGLVREGGVLSLLAAQLALPNLDLELLLAGQTGLVVTFVVILLQTQHPGQGRGDHPGDVHSTCIEFYVNQGSFGDRETGSGAEIKLQIKDNQSQILSMQKVTAEKEN